MQVIPTSTVMPSINEYSQMVDNFIEAGVTCLRCNATRFDNITYKRSLECYKKIFEKKTKRKLNIMLDIPFPKTKYRISYASHENQIIIPKDTVICVTTENKKLGSDELYVDINISDLKKRDRLLIGDGDCELEIIDIQKYKLVCKCLNTGVIGLNKAVYFSQHYSKPLTADEIQRYIELCQLIEPEYIALSFVENADEIKRFRNLVGSLKKKPLIIAKIESPIAVNNIENIIAECDGVMIARGDLALTGGYDKLYYFQQKIINIAIQSKKELYIATELLNNLCNKNYPSRNEVCDVANLFTSGVKNYILSGPLCRTSQLILATKLLEDCEKIYS